MKYNIGSKIYNGNFRYPLRISAISPIDKALSQLSGSLNLDDFL